MIDLVEQFVRGSLDMAGAVIETEGEDEALHVLLPADVARKLEVDEEVRLRTATGTADHAGVRKGTDDADGAELALRGLAPQRGPRALEADALDARAHAQTGPVCDG